MSMNARKVYEEHFEKKLLQNSKINVSSEFHNQVDQIKKLLKNDTTALVSTILEYMIHAATVDIDFQTSNSTLSNLLMDWKKNLNRNLGIDIPSGLRSFTEQYFRERLKSSLLAVRIKWENKNGYIIPSKMWVMDGGSVYAENDNATLTSTKYYLGKPSEHNEYFKNNSGESTIIRKPYNQWYDLYPTPYLVKKGTLYHALFKQVILERQAEIIKTAFPYQLLIKVGTDAALKKHAPSDQDLTNLLTQFQTLKDEYDTKDLSKGLAGAFPHDVNLEELMPDYKKGLDQDITKGVDKNILSSLGMIELRGFSSNREESILNPKVLVEEIVDAVNDYTEMLTDIVELVKEKNSNKYNINSKVEVVPGTIKAFVTDEMRSMIRSWYDRGLVSYQDGLESTTSLNFNTQAIKRDNEVKLNLNTRMYPRQVQNQENNITDISPNNEDVPDDKKKDTPEAQNYKNASECFNITEEFEGIYSIPNEIRNELSEKEQKVFYKAFNEKWKELSKLEMDNYLKEKNSILYAMNKLK